MAFQKFRDRAAMERAHWDFSDMGAAKPCRGCDELVEWVRSPTGKNISLTAPDGCEPHFLTCGGAAPRPASEISQPQRDTRRATAAVPYRPAAGRYDQPAAESAPAPARTPEAGELTAALADLTGAVRALLMELQARKPPAAPARPRFDADGCPM